MDGIARQGVLPREAHGFRSDLPFLLTGVVAAVVCHGDGPLPWHQGAAIIAASCERSVTPGSFCLHVVRALAGSSSHGERSSLHGCGSSSCP